MNIGNTQQVAFQGRVAKTKDGSEYKKTHIASNSLIMASVVGPAIYDIKKVGGFKNFWAQFKAGDKSLKSINLKFGLILTGIAIGGGAILDSIINNSRAKKADAKAKEGTLA